MNGRPGGASFVAGCCSGPDSCAPPNTHWSDEFGIATDKNVILDNSTVLIGTIVSCK
jgi:hypothetical protein